MEESKLLNNISQIETDLDLCAETIIGIPLWRLVRYQTRLHFITAQTGYVARTAPVKIVGKRVLKSFSGFWKLFSIKGATWFFPFNRLVLCNDYYLDKFIDPPIEKSELRNNKYVVVDPPGYVGKYKRIHKNHVIDNESRTVFRKLLSFVCKFYVKVAYSGQIKRLFHKVQDPFNLPETIMDSYYTSVSRFISSYVYYRLWFSILKPKRVFIVYREGYFPIIAACKKLSIPIAEFQHGITLDNTVSYTGEYDVRIDPDYFFVFGDYWKGPQFGMPLDRIHCIGWAYSKYLSEQQHYDVKYKRDTVLVISSMEITDSILEAVACLSHAYPAVKFHIRLHPCESYNEEQNAKLEKIENASIVDNSIDSTTALMSYHLVIGENSSVIYEALSLGCKVGMLNLCGLRSPIDKPGIKENFFAINDIKDFEQFLSEEKSSASNAEFYSDFDSEAFMNFINEKM